MGEAYSVNGCAKLRQISASSGSHLQVGGGPEVALEPSSLSDLRAVDRAPGQHEPHPDCVHNDVQVLVKVQPKFPVTTQSARAARGISSAGFPVAFPRCEKRSCMSAVDS